LKYVSENLVAGEEIKHVAKLHWFMYVFHVVLMVVLVGFVTILGPIIRQFTTEMVVTNRRVIVKVGLISRNVMEMNLQKVESVSVQQGIWGRILGFGTVAVVGSGGSIEAVSYVADPLAFRKAVHEQGAG
jgi:uncharacterized membrane protein YdbT with pleckstrin-like domain